MAKFSARFRNGAIGGTLAAAIGVVGVFEGLRTKAYLDPVGVPTICYGETLGVKLGQVKSVAECKAMLAERLYEFATGLDKCIKVDVPDRPSIAILSWAYNVGLGAACKSTLIKKLNAGDLKGACNELPKWNKAGAKVLKGLVIRRAEEQKICLGGVGNEATVEEVVIVQPEIAVENSDLGMLLLIGTGVVILIGVGVILVIRRKRQ